MPLFPARVVGRVHIRDGPRAHTVKLQDGLALCPGEMAHRRRPVAERSCGHRLGRRLVESVTDADIERAGEDRHVLDTGVVVRRDSISVVILRVPGEECIVCRPAGDPSQLSPPEFIPQTAGRRMPNDGTVSARDADAMFPRQYRRAGSHIVHQPAP